MILRFLFSFLIIVQLSLTAKSLVDTKLEIGIFAPEISGTINNTNSTSDFNTDYGYIDSKASFFALDIDINAEYMPSFYISYLDMRSNENNDVTKSVTVADGDFNASVSTIIDFSMTNIIFYKDFMSKGSYLNFFGRSFYSGDIEFDLGINTKILEWGFEVEDKTDTTKSKSWIKATTIVPLPYLGMKYYFYNMILHSNISAISLSEAKLASYQLGIDYRIIDSLALSVSYLYEIFEILEESDTVNFNTKGYKFSFKYLF